MSLLRRHIKPSAGGGGGTPGNITLVESQIGSTANGNDRTLIFGGSEVSTDVVIFFGGNQDGAGVVTSGYTQIFLLDTASPLMSFGAWYKQVGTDTQVVGLGGPNNQYAQVYGYYILRGVDTSNVLDTTATTATGTNTMPDSPSITTVTNNAWVISVFGQGWSATSTGQPSGYTNLIQDGRVDTKRYGAEGVTKEITTAGAEDPGNYTLASSQSWQAGTIAVRPALI